MANPDIYLASNSPRRRELLAQIGVRFGVIAVDLYEQPLLGETPEDYVLRVALEKAVAGRALIGSAYPAPVLAADTAVVIDDRILGKPKDRADAAAMMRRLSGRTHRVMSAVCLTNERQRQVLSVSEVSFRAVSERETQAYWDTGEPADKAGGYGIQGRGALFVRELRGSYSGVVGLPLYETAQLLSAAGIRPLSPPAEESGRSGQG